MLKDLFRNRLFIRALAFFIFCVVGGMLYMWHVERQEAEKLAETQDRVHPLTKNAQPTTTVADGTDSADGDVHSPIHTIVSVEKPSRFDPVADKMGLMSAEEIDEQEKAKLAFYASLGLEPPPPGYRYARLGDGPPKLVKNKDPIINVAWGEGYGNYHQLTDIELVRYSCLKVIEHPSVIRRYGLSEEEVNLGLAWKQELYEKTKGPRPTITAHLSSPSSDPLTDKEKKALLKRMRDREHELVPRPPESYRVDYDVFDTIIADIRETLSRK